MDASKLERIAKSNEVIHGCRGKPKAEVKVDLLIRRDFKSRPEMQEMLWSTSLRKVACVLEKTVPSIGNLPVEQKTGLPD